MSEGGLFQWKRQDIDENRGPAGSYSNLHRPLPNPPKGMHWVVDPKTREWSLESIATTNTTTTGSEIIVEATPIPDGEDCYYDDKNNNNNNTILLHKVTNTDTFQGICLRYKITPTELRQANGGFSGTNLLLAPNPLKIPKNVPIPVATNVVVPGGGNKSYQDTPQGKIRALREAFPGLLSQSEAKCYLELNDYDLKAAMENAKEDGF